MGPTRTAMRWQKVATLLKGILCTTAQAVDLLDVVLLAALSLIGTGVYQLVGGGWACVVLGALLLSLVMIGVPMNKPPA